MPDYIPTKDAEQITWFNTFAAKFAQHAVTLGFTAADVKSVADDAVMVQSLSLRVDTFQKEAKEAVACRRDMLKKPMGAPVVAVPQNPSPAPPVVNVAPGILARTRALAARIKAAPNYSNSLGRDMGIVGAGDTAVPNPSAKPVLTVATAGAETVDVSFTKNGYQGVLLECQRGTETAWTQMANLRYSPCRDSRPNLAPGVPDVRRYRAIYLVKDKSTGQYSDTVTVTVLWRDDIRGGFADFVRRERGSNKFALSQDVKAGTFNSCHAYSVAPVKRHAAGKDQEKEHRLKL